MKPLRRYCFTALSTDATFRQPCPKVLIGNGLPMTKAQPIAVLSETLSTILWLSAQSLLSRLLTFA